MIRIQDESDCCGCTACANICPFNAITMVKDKMGFSYPIVNVDKCTDCGLCNKTCQFVHDYKTYSGSFEKKVYGVRYRKEEQLLRSQSGAASFAIVEAFIKIGGVVYGVGYKDDSFYVCHKRVESLKDAEQFVGSKYVQSDLNNCFLEIKDDLINGKKVLFIGTGCQVAGLKSYIPVKLHESLYTVDIVCHATPSPAIWKDNIEYLERKNGARIVEVNFRDKKYGWRSFYETYKLSNGKEIRSESYTFLFFEHLSMRKSCSKCPFTNVERVGDLSISDFWGWHKFHEEWNDNKGVSMIMINTDKGLDIFERIKNKILYIESNMQQVLELQPQLSYPSKLNKKYVLFQKDYERYGYCYVLKKYGNESLKEKVKSIFRPFYLNIYKLKSIVK